MSSGYRKKPLPNVTPIDVESGEPMTRARFTGDVTTVSASIMTDVAGVATFWNFWKYDLKRGALRFTWSDPSSRESVDFLFFDTPEETCVDGPIMQIQMQLLMMPA